MTNFSWNDREIHRYLGCGNHIMPDNVEALIEDCKKELENAARPKSVWKELPLSLKEDTITLGNIKTTSKNLARNLRHCSQALLFAATLGSEVDVLLLRYGKLQVSRAVVLQAASVAMLETYCDEQNQILREAYLEKGKYLRPRFSPGYGDFPLESQWDIFPALELSKKIGITLMDSLLMAPSKSVTAVIGIGDVPLKCAIEGCEACGKRDCLYRRS